MKKIIALNTVFEIRVFKVVLTLFSTLRLKK